MNKAAGWPPISNIDIKTLLRRAGAAGAHEGGLFGADDREILGFGVFFEPIHIFFGDRHVGKDRFDRAFGQTGVAVDAGVGVDQEAVGRFVKGLDGTDGGAVGILAVDARGGDDIGHDIVRSSNFSWPGQREKPTKVGMRSAKAKVKP